jgi:hypothetical protein
MRILDRLPISGQHFTLDAGNQSLKLKPFQIIVQVSISNLRAWDTRTPVIPALLDTGLNHILLYPGAFSNSLVGAPSASSLAARINSRGRTNTFSSPRLRLDPSQPIREARSQERGTVPISP